MADAVPDHGGSPVSFAMLLNLASVVNAEQPDLLWGFIGRYIPGASPETEPLLARLVDHADRLLPGFVRPAEALPGAGHRPSARLWKTSPHRWPAMPEPTAETIQNVVFKVGKRHAFGELRAWFGCLYQVLLGQHEGPRFGGFVALYGIPETIALIRSALAARPTLAPEAAAEHLTDG